VVTLFEKYGAGARSIGPRVAEALEVAWIDQAFSSFDIEQSRYPGPNAGNDPGGLLPRFLGRFAAGTVLDDAGIPLAQRQDAELVAENTRNVKEAAAQGGVILGRNGALILADVPDALHVQLDAPLEVRIARAAQEAGISEAHATRRQRNEDHVRREISERLYFWNPMDVDRYHLVVNTGVLDLDSAAAVIVAAYRARVSAAAQEAPDSGSDRRSSR
jgi:cytidylate kinase